MQYLFRIFLRFFRLFIDFFEFMCYNILKQKNKHGSSRVFYSVVGWLPFGDKEIAVQIRGNSHYRN